VFLSPRLRPAMTSDNAGSGDIDPDVLRMVDDAIEAVSGDVVEGQFEVSSTEVYGCTEPRLWTPPLRELTEETSYGFRFIGWCDDRAYPLDPWERWVAIHAGELLPDGRPRFRRVLIIVARQNGKTLLVKLLILWWAYEDSQQMILMTSTSLDYARAAWAQTAEMTGAEVTMPEGVRRMADIEPAKIRQANGQERLTAPGGGTFRIAATKEDSGGRSLTINRLIMDEVRHHTDWGAYHAGMNAMNAVRDGQAWFISNQGDARGVVLRALRASALAGTNRRLGIFEYSAPEGTTADSVDGLRQANPNIGHRLDVDDLLEEARTAIEAGGEALAKFKTEVLCMDVPNLEPAIDPDGWRDCAGDVNMASLRNRVACCLEVALEGTHAVLMAAALDDDGLVRLEVVKVWDNTASVRRSLPRVLARVRPRKFGWFPTGPAAAIATALSAPKRRTRQEWPPPGVEVAEIRTETPAVCMGLAELVDSRGVIHPNDELINAHIADAQRHYQGAVWTFERLGDRPITAAYAAAGAAHLARLLPGPPRMRRLVTVK
jgi:hypothetical protein